MREQYVCRIYDKARRVGPPRDMEAPAAHCGEGRTQKGDKLAAGERGRQTEGIGGRKREKVKRKRFPGERTGEMKRETEKGG